MWVFRAYFNLFWEICNRKMASFQDFSVSRVETLPTVPRATYLCQILVCGRDLYFTNRKKCLENVCLSGRASAFRYWKSKTEIPSSLMDKCNVMSIMYSCYWLGSAHCPHILCIFHLKKAAALLPSRPSFITRNLRPGGKNGTWLGPFQNKVQKYTDRFSWRGLLQHQ